MLRSGSIIENMNDFQNLNTSNREAILQKITRRLEARKEILFAYVHGSFAYGIPFRDLDIALYLDEKGLSMSDYIEYQEELSEILSRELRLIIDVRVLNDSALGFQHSVFKNGRLLFSKDESLRCELIEKVSLEYVDFYEYSLQYLRELVS